MAINQLLDAPGTRQSMRARKIPLRSRYLILILCILAATTLFRTIHLDADPVPWFTEEVGYQIDEGYKTLSPRNLFLYGDIHWNQADQYRGWMTASAITQWPYYWAFELLGPELSSARMVSILYAVVFLVLAAVFLWKRVSPGLAVTGVLLLASDPALFLFSRSALFETSLVLFLYAGLFLAVMLPLRYQRFSVVPVICMSIPAMFFIKLTAIVYMAPVILCLALVSLRERTGRLLNIRLSMIVLPIILVMISAILYLNQHGWFSTFNFSGVVSRPQSLFFNPIHTLSPLALIMAYIVLLELLIRQPTAIMEDDYRLCLASLVVLVPILFSFFIYNYTRYYLPIVPAALLLVIERLSLEHPLKSEGRLNWFSVTGMLAVIVFLALAMTLLATLNYYIIRNMPIAIGSDPGISAPALLKVYPLFLAFLGVFTFFIARRYWSAIGSGLYILLAGLHIIIGLGISVAAVAYPDYQGQEIRNRILQHIKPDESLGGDWAPFFAANTEMHVLYMRPDINSAARVTKLRPDYFLNSDTAYDRKTFSSLKQVSKISISEAIPLGTFRGNEISLHPIYYLDKNGDSVNDLDHAQPMRK